MECPIDNPLSGAGQPADRNTSSMSRESTPSDEEMMATHRSPSPTLSFCEVPPSPSLSDVAAPPTTVKRPRGRPRGSKKEKPVSVTKSRRLQGKSSAKLSKRSKAAAAKAKLSTCLMQRIFESCPISFLFKARLISHQFKDLVDGYPSTWVNCRKYNYGSDMPPPPKDMSERQYCHLLDGKGCVEPDCADTKAEKTYWSWYKRWCTRCWLNAIQKEDHVIRDWRWRFEYSQETVTKLLQCVPYSMQDSWGKPHDVDLSTRSAGEYKLNKVYRKSDLETIRQRYEDLRPGNFRIDRTMPIEQQDAALADHQRKIATLDERREAFFAKEKARVDVHMERVMKIETCVRLYRKSDGISERNKEARKALFQKRSAEDLPHIPLSFVIKTKCYKESCRISRSGGTERSWQILKAKIVADWEAQKEKDAEQTVAKTEEEEEEEEEEAEETTHDQVPESGTSTMQLPGIRDLDQPAGSRLLNIPPSTTSILAGYHAAALSGPAAGLFSARHHGLTGALMGPASAGQALRPSKVTIQSMLSDSSAARQSRLHSPLPGLGELGCLSHGARTLTASSSAPLSFDMHSGVCQKHTTVSVPSTNAALGGFLEPPPRSVADGPKRPEPASTVHQTIPSMAEWARLPVETWRSAGSGVAGYQAGQHWPAVNGMDRRN